MRDYLYRLLEIPFVYRLSQILLGPGAGRMLGPILGKIFTSHPRRMLDVGCGPFLNTPDPEGLIVAVDINPSYINQYTGGFIDQDPRLIFDPPPSRRRLGYLASADKLPFPDASFDEIRSSGLFHHLTDTEAVGALKEWNRCLQPGGWMMILDAVLPVRPWARPLAWLTRRLDRGTHMRRQEDLLKIFQQVCPGDWHWERYTYSYTGLELLYLRYEKKG